MRLQTIGLTVLAFEEQDGQRAAALWQSTRQFGLSLADRACLALAERLHLPALTADRSWSQLQVGVQVQLIR